MRTIKVLVIEPSGEARIEQTDSAWQGIKTLIGGGWLEAVSGDLGSWIAYGDEDGRRKQLQPNGLATGLLQVLRPDRPVLVVGTIVLVGQEYVGGEDGYTEADVPQSIIDMMFPLGEGQ